MTFSFCAYLLKLYQSPKLVGWEIGTGILQNLVVDGTGHEFDF